MKKELLSLVIIGILLLLSIPAISAALIDGLVSYWKLDESSGNAIDSHGNNDGNTTATQGATGIINDAYSFDGTTGDLLNISDAANLYLNTGMTVSFWFKSANSNNDIGAPSMISKTSANGGITEWHIFAWRSAGVDRIWVYIYTGNNLNYIGRYRIGGIIFKDTNWYHFVVTYNGSTTSAGVKIYLNSSQVDNANAAGGTYTGLQNTAEPIWIAGYTAADRRQIGIIDEVGIWNRSLNSAEVEELYNSGAGLAYPFVADTCTCPGLNQNWEIAMSDYCNITSDCDLGTGMLSFTGAGITKCDAKIKTSDLGDPGSTGLLKKLSDCLIWII